MPEGFRFGSLLRVRLDSGPVDRCDGACWNPGLHGLPEDSQRFAHLFLFPQGLEIGGLLERTRSRGARLGDCRDSWRGWSGARFGQPPPQIPAGGENVGMPLQFPLHRAQHG